VCVCVCACVRICVCKCVCVHTVLFLSEKPDSHGFNTSVMRAGCVCVCVYVCMCVCVCDNTRWQTKARARRCVAIWITSYLTLMCVRADQEHSRLMGEHRLGCSTLQIFYHGKRSHALVTQCVRVRACKNPRRDREEMRWRLFVPTDKSPYHRNSPIHTKSKDQERTRKVLCA